MFMRISLLFTSFFMILCRRKAFLGGIRSHRLSKYPFGIFGHYSINRAYKPQHIRKVIAAVTGMRIATGTFAEDAIAYPNPTTK